ncbi:DUF945 family protein [Ferrimonas marina]|nr:DUF945 family protein [Ferrimonas marina]
MNKGFLAAALATVVAIPAASWYTGQQYQKIVEQQMALASEMPNVEVTLEVMDDSLFGRTERYLYLMDDPSLEIALEFAATQTLSFWPLFLRGEVALDFEHGTLAEFAQQLETLPQMRGGWSAFIPGGKAKVDLQLDAMALTLPDGEAHLALSPIHYRGDFALDLSTSYGELSLASLTFRVPDNDGELLITDLHFSGDAVMTDGIAEMQSMAFQLGEFRFDDGHDVSLVMTALTMSGETQEQESTLDLVSLWSVQELQFASALDGSKTGLSNLRFDTVFKGLDKAAYRRLQQLEQSDPIQMEHELIEALDALLAAGIQWQLSDVSADLDVMMPGQTLKGQFQTQGQLSMAPTSIQQLIGPMAIAQFSAQLDINFSESLFAQHPLAPVLEQLTETGMFTLEQERFRTELQFEQGMIQLNGQPLPM